jgi:hypothetical protein
LVYYQWVLKANLWLALVFAICAVSFHYLAAAVLPFLFLVKHRFALDKRHALGLGVLLLLAIVLGKYLLFHYLVPIVPRFGGQTRLMDATSSYFSPVFYPEFFLIFLSLVFWKDCTDNMKRVIGLQFAGFAIFYGFFEHAVISIRLREVFSVFWLFYVADYSRVTANLRAGIVIFVLLNIALGSYLFYFSGYLIKP